MKKTVILTGATGYIGQFAIRYLLEKKYIVHAITSKPIINKPVKNLIWHEVNLLNFQATKNLLEKVSPTHLLHFSWYVEHGKFWNAEENMDWLQASLNLAREFSKNGGKRAVFAGTCVEYDWTKSGLYSEDKTPFAPHTLYGATKTSLAMTVEKFAKVSNFSFASGKIFFVFGANEPPNRLVPSIIQSLLNDEVAKTSHGNQIRDFMFVEDLAEAFIELLESNVEGAVNVASGKGIKLKEITELIAEILGKKELLSIGALPASKDEPDEIVADIKRLREEVGFSRSFDIKEKLEDTINWWKKKYESSY